MSFGVTDAEGARHRRTRSARDTSAEGSEHGLGRMRDRRKKRACGSARHPLALAPSSDIFKRETRGAANSIWVSRARRAQTSDLGYCNRCDPSERGLRREPQRR